MCGAITQHNVDVRAPKRKSPGWVSGNGLTKRHSVERNASQVAAETMGGSGRGAPTDGTGRDIGLKSWRICLDVRLALSGGHSLAPPTSEQRSVWRVQSRARRRCQAIASTAERKFDDVLSRGKFDGVCGECAATQEPREIVARETPFEGARDGLIVVLKAKDAVGDRVL